MIRMFLMWVGKGKTGGSGRVAMSLAVVLSSILDTFWRLQKYRPAGT